MKGIMKEDAHGCYQRMDRVWREHGTTRHQFCKMRDIGYTTLQNDWGRERAVLRSFVVEAVCQEYNLSADWLLLGRNVDNRLRPALQDVVTLIRGHNDIRVREFRAIIRNYIITEGLVPENTG